MKMIKMIDKVKGILDDNEKARDNDCLLECMIYDKYLDIEKRSVLDFYLKLDKRQLPSPASIRRARRKCQELYPNTRGEKYNLRKSNQKTIKSELNEAKLQSSNPGWF